MEGQSKSQRSSGFTLIELMIALAIVAILVAMAIPAYKDYTIRSKIAECINGAAVAKVQISEYRQSLGPWPPSAQDAGLDSAGISRFCDGFINYVPGSGAFTVDINENEVDPSLAGNIAPQLTPTENAGSSAIDWECSYGATQISNIKYLPSTCRGS